MSNKRIDLWGISFDNFLDWDASSNAFEKYDTLVWCEFDDMYYFPEFSMKCIANEIKPLCGLRFRLHTPEDCLVDEINIICYAEDEEGCEELQFLYCRCNGGELKYEDFCKFSNHLQVGLDLVLAEVDMLIIDNILEFVLVPDFVLIDLNQYIFRCWEKCRKILEEKNILICGSGFPMSYELEDENVLSDFFFLGDKAYEYVIENPQKIADRITGNYNFDISLIKKIRQSRMVRHYRIP